MLLSNIDKNQKKNILWEAEDSYFPLQIALEKSRNIIGMQAHVIMSNLLRGTTTRTKKI